MSKEVDKLKAYRAPWWARGLGRFNSWRATRRRLRERQLIATVTIFIHPAGLPSQEYQAWYHLYEDGKGNRTYKFVNGEGRQPFDYRHGVVFNRYISPWLDHSLTNAQIRECAARSHNRSNWADK